MPPPPSRCQLVSSAGLRIPIKAPGLLIGRSSECHVVLDDEHVSRRQVQIWLGTAGVELIPLGRNPVVVNGASHSAPVTLGDGDQLVIADHRFRIEIAASTRSAEDAAPWGLEHAGVWYGVHRNPFTIGGGHDDDLIVHGWSTAAVRLHEAQNALFVEIDSDGVTLNDAAAGAGDVEPLGEGDRLGLGELELTLRRRIDTGEAPTRALVVHPERVELRLLPRGGRLSLTFAGVTRTLVVSERRLELLSALLQPPAPLRPGDFVSDATILQRVWPRSDRADHSDLNVLIHRVRRDLVKAGMNGPALIARQAGGGGTRFTIQATTEVAIVSG